YIVPFARYGSPTVNRSPNPHIRDFLRDLSAAGGADANLVDSNFVPYSAEIGLFDQHSPLWIDNHGAPRPPQPGNYPKRNYDDARSPEADTRQKPLQTAAGSTPTGHAPFNGGDGTASIILQKDINAADPLHPTPDDDPTDPANPRRLLIGTNVT